MNKEQGMKNEEEGGGGMRKGRERKKYQVGYFVS